LAYSQQQYCISFSSASARTRAHELLPPPAPRMLMPVSFACAIRQLT
jgi:hypothetical protein